jgi:nucleotide-binding universal stress UspA family protein
MERILCAVDFSPSSHDTLACAASLAKALGTALEIVHVVRPPVTLLTDLPPSFLLADLRKVAERELVRETGPIRRLARGLLIVSDQGPPVFR